MAALSSLGIKIVPFRKRRFLTEGFTSVQEMADDDTATLDLCSGDFAVLVSMNGEQWW